MKAKTPLRYPGGKSRAVDRILPLIPASISEYREPFVGGGSVFLAVRALFGRRLRYVISDLNYDLICFWTWARDDVTRLAAAVGEHHQRYLRDGRALHTLLMQGTFSSDFERAVRFFIMNRITFSGVTDAGGYSQQAFDKRFTASSIERLPPLAALLRGVEIRHNDYDPVLREAGENVLIFLDPPYYSASDSRLYGVRGALHTSFDHLRFARVARECPHRWLITYDDSPFIRGLFDFARVRAWELQYGMNNFTQGSVAKGKELFISNYEAAP